ncbi:MAG TPA: hypothetical protein VG267_09295 [Terracidiphilus sp.]|jgi:hypothetical protein|nr:hypothetical protein [Terracidiphilus sp.]
MRVAIPSLLAALAAAPLLLAQSAGLDVPKTVEAGSAFTITTSGSGPATLVIVGPGQAIKRDVQLGQPISIAAGKLYNAGHYLAILSGSAAEPAGFDVVPAKPADLSFLARPSRLPVSVRDGITGAAYVFDAYGNLVTAPTAVSFDLTTPGAAAQSRTSKTQNGEAWVAMDSSPREGAAHFVARAGDISSTRVIGQVPGDPCGLKMSAKAAGNKIELETDPVKDCSGNPVPDGTIVTFTENFNGSESTVDVPLKRGVAKVEMPAQPGASISVASGVVLGNQIRWGR